MHIKSSSVTFQINCVYISNQGNELISPEKTPLNFSVAAKQYSPTGNRNKTLSCQSQTGNLHETMPVVTKEFPDPAPMQRCGANNLREKQFGRPENGPQSIRKSTSTTRPHFRLLFGVPASNFLFF